MLRLLLLPCSATMHALAILCTSQVCIRSSCCRPGWRRVWQEQETLPTWGLAQACGSVDEQVHTYMTAQFMAAAANPSSGSLQVDIGWIDHSSQHDPAPAVILFVKG